MWLSNDLLDFMCKIISFNCYLLKLIVSLWLSMSMSVSVLQCLPVYRHAYVDAHICVPACGGQRSLSVVFLSWSQLYLLFQTRILSMEPLISPKLSGQQWDLAVTRLELLGNAAIPAFTHMLGSKLRTSWLHSKNFILIPTPLPSTLSNIIPSSEQVVIIYFLSIFVHFLQ